jgi:hypothetical protein
MEMKSRFENNRDAITQQEIEEGFVTTARKTSRWSFHLRIYEDAYKKSRKLRTMMTIGKKVFITIGNEIYARVYLGIDYTHLDQPRYAFGLPGTGVEAARVYARVDRPLPAWIVEAHEA